MLLRFLIRFLFLFVLLFILTLPFPYYFFPDIPKSINALLSGIVQWWGDHFFQLNKPYSLQVSSDSLGLYIQTFLQGVISIATALIWTFTGKQKELDGRLKYWLRTVSSYYLSLQLFKYGFDKIFKHQFYQPEPNILFTSFGELSKDILYWSAMGTSYSYSIFMGLLEVLPAFLLLLRRTRTLGAFIALGVLLNVVMINISFDISVKLFAAFLLLLCLVILTPDLKRIYFFFVRNQFIQTSLHEPVPDSKRNLLFYSIGKSVVIGGILLEVLFAYFRYSSFNDDSAQRPLLHGAYDVVFFRKNEDTIASLLTEKERLKRIFVHRQGYFITQTVKDSMQDYSLRYDEENSRLMLLDYEEREIVLDYLYTPENNILQLKGTMPEDTIEIHAKKIDLSKLPAIKEEFHWTSDF